MDTKDLEVSISEAAELTGRSKDAIRRAIRSGKLRAVQVDTGRGPAEYRLNRGEVEEWASGDPGATTATTPPTEVLREVLDRQAAQKALGMLESLQNHIQHMQDRLAAQEVSARDRERELAERLAALEARQADRDRHLDEVLTAWRETQAMIREQRNKGFFARLLGK